MGGPFLWVVTASFKRTGTYKRKPLPHGRIACVPVPKLGVVQLSVNSRNLAGPTSLSNTDLVQHVFPPTVTTA